MKKIKDFIRKNIILILLSIVLIFGILLGTNIIFKDNYLEFNNDGILLTYTVTPVYGQFSEMYDIVTKIYNNGKIEILHDNQIVDTFTIGENHIKSLQNEIARVNFMELDEDVSTISADGGYYSITVNTKTKTHTSKGLNPSDKRFCKLETAIKNMTEK